MALGMIVQQKLGEAVNTIQTLAKDNRPFVIRCVHCSALCPSNGPKQTFAFIALAYDMSLNVCVCTNCLTKAGF
jgi:hypothetical protein